MIIIMIIRRIIIIINVNVKILSVTAIYDLSNVPMGM